MRIEIKEISADKTYAIRLEVLRKGMDLPVEFSGDFDADTFHLGLYENNELKGICSFMKTKNELFVSPQYQLRGMATLPESRGKGFGKLLLIQAIEVLKERKIKLLWCNAREIALPFYIKLGFLQKGEAFEIPQVGAHFRLYKELEC